MLSARVAAGRCKSYEMDKHWWIPFLIPCKKIEERSELIELGPFVGIHLELSSSSCDSDSAWDGSWMWSIHSRNNC